MRLLAAALVVASVASCRSGDATSSGSASATTATRTVLPIPPGAPPIDGCTVDADCVVAVTAPSDLCCDYTVTAMPMSTKYLGFVAAARKASCAGVTCPPEALPGAQLAPCGYEARCNSGKCTNACTPTP